MTASCDNKSAFKVLRCKNGYGAKRNKLLQVLWKRCSTKSADRPNTHEAEIN